MKAPTSNEPLPANFFILLTGKSLLEALIFAVIHPQYDNILFMELPCKILAKNMFCTCSFHVLNW